MEINFFLSFLRGLIMRYIDSLPATFRKYILDTEYHRYRPPGMCGTMWIRMMQEMTVQEKGRWHARRQVIEVKYYQNWMAIKNLKPSPFLPSAQLNVFYESCKIELAVNGNGEEITKDVPEGPQHWFNPFACDIQESIREMDLIFSARYWK